MRDRPNDQHRRVVEAKLGRKLSVDEVVDHADEDKSNNADSNLRVKDRSQHTGEHNRTRGGLSKLRKALRTSAGKEPDGKLY